MTTVTTSIRTKNKARRETTTGAVRRRRANRHARKVAKQATKAEKRVRQRDNVNRLGSIPLSSRARRLAGRAEARAKVKAEEARRKVEVEHA